MTTEPEEPRPKPKPKPKAFPISEVLLQDPLGSAARSERRNVLAASFIALVVRYAHLVPTRFQGPGIDFDVSDRRVLVWAFLALAAYLLVAFLVYAVADFLAAITAATDREKAEIREWQRDYDENSQAMQEAARSRDRPAAPRVSTPGAALQVLAERYPWYRRLKSASGAWASVRAVVEYVVPLGIGTWALFELWLLGTGHVPL